MTGELTGTGGEFASAEASAPSSEATLPEAPDFSGEAGVERLPIPPTPPGTKPPEFGSEIMQWGSGSDAARQRIETLTRDWLVEKGVTREIAEAWRDFYMNETERYSGNPSAPGRAELMAHAAELLRAGDPADR